jgi:predicted transcriptional regulator
MLTAQLINPNIPQLSLDDYILKAQQLISDYKLTHLPVVADKKFLGLISEEDLLDMDGEKAPLKNVQDLLQFLFILDDIHFLNAVNFCNQHETNIVPVLSKDAEFLGVITIDNLLKALGEFAGAHEIGGIIILEIPRIQFAISEISRIVESNNCTILHLNSTMNASTGMMSITLHLDKREIEAVVATFERYEYTVVHHFGVRHFESDAAANFRNLMKYLDL